MRIDYFTTGIDSLETSLEQLALNTDRNLKASILLGFHAVSCLLKAAAVELGLVVRRGYKSIKFPSVVGALKAKGWLKSTDSKALQLLNELRNALEHQEVDYDRERFRVALYGVLPIIERIVRECNSKDLQDELSREAWDVLLEIEEFFKHRETTLAEIVEEALDKPRDKDYFFDPAEAVYCEYCYHEGLPWKGTEREEVVCKFCGNTSLIATCAICNCPIIIDEDEEWPYIHSECWDDYLNRND
ncbi:MAG: hypothetical protein HPY70_14470 [Firmicutes bacterium]|nr:hypothetical protein [Bacillota bacterium]